ncbi:hypothetical protein P378_02620 [Desulforamulus profundi]|uniref:Uncharacterized protein n=1 Tax=Desulforamulus profundi TaxID=1383067 RepID=A0A2C6MIL6_9FIRM|nr:hypothetical protein P378_02620 [Desulforamulus profundi]
MRKRRVERPVVAVTRDPLEGQAVCRAIEMLPADEIFKPGDTVVITPNWVNTNFLYPNKTPRGSYSFAGH